MLEHAKPGDTVWIHDFHLLLLPRMLREANRDLRIGFFLHTPFPASELVLSDRDRTHPRLSELGDVFPLLTAGAAR